MNKPKPKKSKWDPRSVYFLAEDVAQAEALADRYAQGNLSRVLRTAVALGLAKVEEDPSLLLTSD